MLTNDWSRPRQFLRRLSFAVVCVLVVLNALGVATLWLWNTAPESVDGFGRLAQDAYLNHYVTALGDAQNLQKVGDSDGALAAYEALFERLKEHGVKFRTYAPVKVPVMESLIAIYVDQGRLSDATYVATHWHAKAENDINVRLTLAKLYLAKNDADSAISIIKPAFKRFPFKSGEIRHVFNESIAAKLEQSSHATDLNYFTQQKELLRNLYEELPYSHVVRDAYLSSLDAGNQKEQNIGEEILKRDALKDVVFFRTWYTSLDQPYAPDRMVQSDHFAYSAGCYQLVVEIPSVRLDNFRFDINSPSPFSLSQLKAFLIYGDEAKSLDELLYVYQLVLEEGAYKSIGATPHFVIKVPEDFSEINEERKIMLQFHLKESLPASMLEIFQFIIPEQQMEEECAFGGEIND